MIFTAITKMILKSKWLKIFKIILKVNKVGTFILMISKLSMNDVIMLFVSVIVLSKKKKERKKENVEIYPRLYRKSFLINFHI